MIGFTFDEVWRRRRALRVDGVEDIVAAKSLTDRPKDRLFLATHAAELRRLLGPPPA